MATQYETVEGTNPFDNPEEEHDPRTIERIEDDGSLYMMTEIDDGVFVQWSTCYGCRKNVKTCTCKAGPKAPDYIDRWRDERFEKSIHRRKARARDPWIAQGVKPYDPDAEPAFKATEQEKIDLQVALDAVREAKAQEIDNCNCDIDYLDPECTNPDHINAEEKE